MMEGGIAFETARAGHISTFDGTSSSKPQFGNTHFEGIESVWNANAPSRLWGTSRSRLDTSIAGVPTRPTPVRQGSLSSYVQKKTSLISTIRPADLDNDDALKSKLSWGSRPSAGFALSNRTQILSPTKQKQDQMLEFVASSSIDSQQASLFTGSAPDVEDLDLSVNLKQTSLDRRGTTTATRKHPSPSRNASSGHGQLDPRIQAFNVSNSVANDVYGTSGDAAFGQDFAAHGADRLPTQNIVSGVRPSIKMPSGGNVNFDLATPLNGCRNEHFAQTRALNSYYHPGQCQEVDQSFECLSLDLEPVLVTPSQRYGTQKSYQHESQNSSSQLIRQTKAYSQAFDHDLEAPATYFQHPISRLNPQAAPHIGTSHHAHLSTYHTGNDYRGDLTSPYYSATGTPPTGPQSVRTTPGSGASSRTSHHDPFMFDRSITDVDQYGYDQSFGKLHMDHGYQYDLQIAEHMARINPYGNSYMDHGHVSTNHYPAGPRVPLREIEQPHIFRSPLLEEFRMNGKTNRRFEIKDIYGSIVEFSGDQHGSRFIQSKLETANSDEKDQVFQEIQPNLLQLTTDVFGNYVIQKMFEHGNQTQKKVLANHMKNHVMHLSMQTYGCRVVQKAFEYVLDDQQASLVKELDGPNLQILKVVKDQNGNHVVQKAIERIPGKHIQFIIDAHRGQMAKMSTHQYGCRVVQRMLEHCEPAPKRVILDELFEHILPLINDSFGNYVVQHIIANGEPRDRRQVVGMIIQQLQTFSKHKFASNVVEKSLDRADPDQRQQLLDGLTAPNEHGVTPVLGLMRDQYGNYVLQKVYNCLEGLEKQSLRLDMLHNYPILKKTSYGKQVIAMEKLLFGGNSRNNASTSATSGQNSTLPSPNGSNTTNSDGFHGHQQHHQHQANMRYR